MNLTELLEQQKHFVEQLQIEVKHANFLLGLTMEYSKRIKNHESNRLVKEREGRLKSAKWCLRRAEFILCEMEGLKSDITTKSANQGF